VVEVCIHEVNLEPMVEEPVGELHERHDVALCWKGQHYYMSWELGGATIDASLRW
jgi:hypothetical protein